MKYLLMIHMNDEVFAAMSEEQRLEVMSAHEPFMKALKESGEYVTTEALAGPSQSRTVRVLDGVPAVTDGPYLEAKEYLAGYYEVECESFERAVELAAQMPEAKIFGVEVRRLVAKDGELI